MDGEEKIPDILSTADFEILFREYFGPLCSYAIRYTKDLDSAKEIVHIVFVNIWEKRETIDKTQNLRSYLYTSVYNRCLNFLRNAKITMDIGKTQDSRITTDIASNLESMELQAKIDASIKSLPDRCREVFVMSRFENMKYSQIAEKLEISIKTVEVQMSKALRILREHLAEYLCIIFILFI